MTNEFIEGVVEDLRFVREVLTPPLGEHMVQHAGAKLARLLLDHQDGDLSLAWSQAGFAGQPRVTARSLREFLRLNRGRWISRASAGDAVYEAPPVPGTLHAPTGIRSLAAVYGPPTDADLMTSIKVRVTLPLKQFLSEPCLVINNKTFSRRQVVKYGRQKLAFVHWDEKGRGETGQLLSALEDMQMNKENGTMRAIYFEVLAIGQSLVASEDVQALCDSVAGSGRRPGC